MLHDALRNRAGSAAEVQVGSEHVVPLRAPGLGVGRERETPARQMAESTATGPGGQRGRRSVRRIRYVFPLAIVQLLVVHAESFFLAHHEYGGEIVRYKASVGIEERFTVRVLLHRVR